MLLPQPEVAGHAPVLLQPILHAAVAAVGSLCWQRCLRSQSLFQPALISQQSFYLSRLCNETAVVLTQWVLAVQLA